MTWIRVAAMVLIVASAGACSNDSAPPSTRSVEPPEGGSLEFYMNSFAASHLNDVELPRSITSSRARVVENTEDAFVNAVEEDPASASATSSFNLLDRDATIYLGYLYCIARDSNLAIGESVASVVDVVARVGGRDPAAPANEDFIASVTIVNHASGSLCPELYVDTHEFLEELTASQ